MNLIIYVFALILSIVIHEIAHGFVADKCGDPTARLSGRLTLNPLNHLDPIGSILIPLFVFITTIPVPGWAKPVPVNPYNLNNPRIDMVKVAFAGPFANIGLAVVSSIILRLPIIPPNTYLEHLFLCFVVANFLLALFNLIPIPPLDGSRIVAGLLPSTSFRPSPLEPFGFIIIILLLYSGAFKFIVNLALYLSCLGVGERFLHFAL
ncbi:TPA: site-2 protease family protein [bacterium]|nr:site-2 protease family protein [bacterium]